RAFAAESLGGLEHAVTAAASFESSFCAGHGESSLLVRKELLDLVMMRVGHVGTVSRLALALLGAPRQQVALEHVRKLEFAAGGALEPLLCTGVSLDLGHGWSERKAGSYAPGSWQRQAVSRRLWGRRNPAGTRIDPKRTAAQNARAQAFAASSAVSSSSSSSTSALIASSSSSSSSFSVTGRLPPGWSFFCASAASWAAAWAALRASWALRTTPGLGAMTMIMRRPSMLGVASTVAMSLHSSTTRFKTFMPVCGCVISRPRNTTASRTLFPPSRKRRTCFTLKSMSCSSVLGRNLISLVSTVEAFLRCCCFFFASSYLYLP